MNNFRQKIYKIIFEADTRAGKIFDESLLIIIVLSIIVVMLESVASLRQLYGPVFKIVEWTITTVFLIEYIARIWATNKPSKYILSFYGIIDLIALLPSFLALFLPVASSFLVIRALRLLRVFRLFKLTRYTKANRVILKSITDSREKISVFILFVLTLAIIIGTLMYLIEGEQNGFTSIPKSIYWAIVTLTTVGYGDISPATGLGQFLSSIVMLLGYSIIAVPTGIITSALLKNPSQNTQVCQNCMFDRHDDDAFFCKKCGAHLDINPNQQT